MTPGRFFIIGLGSIGMPLIGMLARDFHLVCIDQNPAVLEQARELRGEGLEGIQGDATSRLVLERAGLSLADTVVITTSEEAVNLEVARVLSTHFPGVRVIAVGITTGGIEELKALGIEVESIFAVSATGLRNRLEHRTKAVHGIGLGKNEILEVEVDPHSRLVNRPLGKLRPKNWRFGLIYREGNIIVPRPTTTLKGRDKVVILGEPKVLRAVAERLSFSFLDFPLEYGDTAVVLLTGTEDSAFLGEIGYLASTLPLERFLFLQAPGIAPPEELLQFLTDTPPGIIEIGAKTPPAAAVAMALRQFPCNPGLFILSPQALFPPGTRPGRAKRQIFEIFDQASCPVLVAAGTFPYERAAVPCLQTDPCQNALEAALEISAGLYNRIDALIPVPSPYIAGQDDLDNFQNLKKTVSDLALVYKANLRKIELTGNPIHAVRDALVDYNLLVSEISPQTEMGWLRRLFHIDPAWRIVHSVPVSALLIPSPETVL